MSRKKKRPQKKGKPRPPQAGGEPPARAAAAHGADAPAQETVPAQGDATARRPEHSPEHAAEPAPEAPRATTRRGACHSVRLLVTLLVAVGYLAAALWLSGRYRVPGTLNGEDLLSLPGAPATLRAVLEYGGPRFLAPDVDGATIDFRRLGPRTKTPVSVDENGESLGVAAAGADGVVTLSLTAPTEPGNYIVRLVPLTPERLGLAAGTPYLVWSVTGADEALVLTDIDNTVSEADVDAVLDGDAERVAPLPGAAETLRVVAERARVVYLTARPTTITAATRAWLAEHGFPLGPLYTRDLASEDARYRMRRGTFKSHVIQNRIRPIWPNIIWGIGNTAGDRLAYRQNGIPSILVNAPPRAGEIVEDATTHTVPDWGAARELIAASLE